MISINGSEGPVKFSRLIFSGGEIQVKLDVSWVKWRKASFKINAHLTSSDEVMTLVLLVDALRRHSTTPDQVYIELECPYLPYARQDRVMEDGESLSLRVMCNLINSLRFDRVTVWDPHSDVAMALLDNISVVDQTSLVLLVPVLKSETVLVSPDAGAMKKTHKIAKGLGFSMVTAEKIRSTEDGSITGTQVHSDHIGKKDFLIVDDICDGGRTFIELAKELKKLTDGRILLYVTHGIFSKGLDVFDGLIDHVYTALPFPTVGEHPKLTVLPTGVKF